MSPCQNHLSRSPHCWDDRHLTQGQHHYSSHTHNGSCNHGHTGSCSKSPLSHRPLEPHRYDQDGESSAEDVSYLRTKLCRLEHLIEAEKYANIFLSSYIHWINTIFYSSEMKSIKTLGRGFQRLVHLTDHPSIIADQAQIHMVAVRDHKTQLTIRVLQEMDKKDRSSKQRAELAASHVWVYYP